MIVSGWHRLAQPLLTTQDTLDVGFEQTPVRVVRLIADRHNVANGQYLAINFMAAVLSTAASLPPLREVDIDRYVRIGILRRLDLVEQPLTQSVCSGSGEWQKDHVSLHQSLDPLLPLTAQA